MQLVLLFGLPFLFMYIFPVFFLWKDTLYTKPVVATVFLGLGIILWLVKHLLIIGLIRHPYKLKKKHKKVQETGRPVQAKVLSSEIVDQDGDYPVYNILLSFNNLVGNPVRTILRTSDTKPHERRFETGKQVELRLNQTDFDPPYTVATGQYAPAKRILHWVWLFFDIAYSIALFLVSYHFQSKGMGWRFLGPQAPWFWAPIVGISMIVFLSKILGLKGDDTQQSAYEFHSTSKSKDLAQLLLHGRSANGEVLSFSQTGTYINEQPEIRFNIQYENEYGVPVRAYHTQIISLVDLHSLRKAKIEVLYLPGNPNLFMYDYVDESKNDLQEPDS